MWKLNEYQNSDEFGHKMKFHIKKLKLQTWEILLAKKYAINFISLSGKIDIFSIFGSHQSFMRLLLMKTWLYMNLECVDKNYSRKSFNFDEMATQSRLLRQWSYLWFAGSSWIFTTCIEFKTSRLIFTLIIITISIPLLWQQSGQPNSRYAPGWNLTQFCLSCWGIGFKIQYSYEKQTELNTLEHVR